MLTNVGSDHAHMLGSEQWQRALDKAGREAVGGVVLMRYGENPLKVINAIKEKIAELSVGVDRIVPRCWKERQRTASRFTRNPVERFQDIAVCRLS